MTVTRSLLRCGALIFTSWVLPTLLHAQTNVDQVAIGDSEFANHHYTQAAAAYEKAIAELASAPKPVERADLQLKLLRALLWGSDWARCYTLSKSIIDAYDKHVAPNDSRIISACSIAGLAAQRVGQRGEAEALYRRALAMQEYKFGAESPQVSAALHNLTGVVHDSGRYQEAEQLARKKLSIDEKQQGPNHEELTWDLDEISCMLNAQHKTQEALPFYRRSAVLKEKKEYGQTHMPVPPQMYASFYAEALKKLGWSAEQVSAELQSLVLEAQNP